jgi:hypothetical protein
MARRRRTERDALLTEAARARIVRAHERVIVVASGEQPRSEGHRDQGLLPHRACDVVRRCHFGSRGRPGS